MDNPLISIIMPVYNEGITCAVMIESIRRQTYTNWELLIVDDGSTDHTAEICAAIICADERITLLKEQHNGQATARNIGIEKARGSLLAFADADDSMEEDYLKCLLHNMRAANADLSVCNYIDERMEKRVEGVKVRRKEYRKICDLRQDSTTRSMVARKDDVVLWNKLYKREIFNEIRFTDHRFYEDLALMTEIYDKCHVVVYDSRKLYFYRYNKKGTIANLSEKKVTDYFWAMQQRMDIYCRHAWKNDLWHSANALVYQSYDFYGRARQAQQEADEKICKTIRYKMYAMMKKYRLIQYLPPHGQFRLLIFIYFPSIYHCLWQYRN